MSRTLDKKLDNYVSAASRSGAKELAKEMQTKEPQAKDQPPKEAPTTDQPPKEPQAKEPQAKEPQANDQAPKEPPTTDQPPKDQPPKDQPPMDPLSKKKSTMRSSDLEESAGSSKEVEPEPTKPGKRGKLIGNARTEVSSTFVAVPFQFRSSPKSARLLSMPRKSYPTAPSQLGTPGGGRPT